MAINNFPKQTPEQVSAMLKAAQERRRQFIRRAIQSGAQVNYINTRLTSDEWETHISWDKDGIAIIDTTIPQDITKCINRGWEIIQVTYYAGTKNVAGIIFKGKTKDISIRNIKRSKNAISAD